MQQPDSNRDGGSQALLRPFFDGNPGTLRRRREGNLLQGLDRRERRLRGR